MQMITNNYYAVALNEYRYLKRVDTSDFPNITIIHTQQVVEKLLKFVVITFCTNHADSEVALKRHNLKKLYKIIEDENIPMWLPKAQLADLTAYYFEARYPGDDFVNVTKEEVITAQSLMEDVLSAVQDVMRLRYCLECGEPLGIGICTNPNCALKSDNNKTSGGSLD